MANKADTKKRWARTGVLRECKGKYSKFEYFSLILKHLDLMDPIKETIAQLKEECEAKKMSQNDLYKVKLAYSEIKNELALKRVKSAEHREPESEKAEIVQVTQTRNDLDKANAKIYELNRNLEMANLALKHGESQQKIKGKELATLESKYKTVQENYRKLQMTHDMTACENAALTSHKQQVDEEKHELTKKVEELRVKCNYFASYVGELNSHCVGMKEGLANINAAMTNFRANYTSLMQLGQKITSVTESMEYLKFLQEKIEELQKQNDILNLEKIQLAAKYETLTRLLEENVDPRVNLETELVFLEFKKNVKFFEEQYNNQVEVINNLQECLSNEKASNIKLIAMLNEEKTPCEISNKI